MPIELTALEDNGALMFEATERVTAP